MKIVILAGGRGTRLWPLSTNKTPKQFQKLISNKTLFQETIKRIDFLDPKDIYIATNEEYVNLVKKQAPQIPLKNIIAEPAMRDTAPCIGLAAAIINKYHPNEVMAVIYADHLVQNKKEFIKKLKLAEQTAKEENTLNIIEVQTENPNPNLGYVKTGKCLNKTKDGEIYEFLEFKEKPNIETAKKYHKDPNYLWNTGFYVWETKKILSIYQKFTPKTYKHLLKIQKSWDSKEQNKVLQKEYPLCPKISIDFGIMEKINKKDVRIIPASLGWSDIGSFESIHSELTNSDNENHTLGEVQTLETSGSLIYNHQKTPIKVIGVKDLIIINTTEGLLVCKKGKSQEIKKIL